MTSKPGLPVILVFAAVCFAPLIEGGTAHTPVFILKLVVLTILLVQTRLWLAGGQGVGVIPGLDFPLVFVIIAALVSLFVAPYKFMALTWVQLIIYYCLFYMLARAALRGRESLRGPVQVLMFMGVVEIAIAARQLYLGVDRVKGTFFNPDVFAGYIAVPAIFALSFLVNGDLRTGGRIGKVLSAALFLASLAAVVLSGSRGGLLCFIAGSFVVLWMRSRILSLVFAASLAAMVLLVPNPVRDRVFSEEPFAYSRVGIWESALRMAEDHPLGVGLGNFKYEWGRYNFPIEGAVIRYGKKARTAHNEYLHFTAEAGIPGLIAIASCIYVILGALRSSARDPAGPKMRPVAVGALGGASAVLVHAAVDSNLHEPGTVFLFIFTVCIGLEAGGIIWTAPSGRLIPEAARKRFAALVLVLALLLGAWAVKDETARYYFEKGGREFGTSGPAAALAPAEMAVLLDPSNAVYREQDASVYYAIFKTTRDEKYLGKTLEELSEAEGLNPNYPKYPSLTASIKTEVAEGLKDAAKRRALLESALADSGRALDCSPFDAELIYVKAELYSRLGETGMTEKLLTMLRDIEPNFLRGRYALALIYSRTGRDELSRQECYSIIRINERLSGRPLDKTENRFVSVDMEKVKSLLGSLAGA